MKKEFIRLHDFLSTDPEDYFFIPRVVTFPAGETSMEITVQTNSDNVVDDGETFEAIISNPSDGLEIGSMDVATVTIMGEFFMHEFYFHPCKLPRALPYLSLILTFN